MFHKVGYPVAHNADTFLNVSADDFRRQMRVLYRLGYRARSFAEVVDAAHRKLSLPPRTFAITFDDGYRCIHELAAPILTEFGFPATVFAVSGQIGGTNVWDAARGKPVLPLMDEEDLRHIIDLGWEIGGHTRTHPLLGNLNNEAARDEIRGGKEELEARFHTPITTFCYPYGHINADTPSLVRDAGLMGACTTSSGRAGRAFDPYLIPRVKVSYSDGVFGLLFRLWVRPFLPDARPRRSLKLAPGRL